MKESLPFSDIAEHRYSTALGSSKLRFEFTGSGWQYFRIWIVNLLLTLLTLGLYYPWAQVRRLKYFYAHTAFDGDPLAFDGSAVVLARGYGLVAALLALVWVASCYSKAAGAAVVLMVGLLAPWLIYATLHYRLHHTSWRGLRFGFRGTLKDAYRANLPLSFSCAVVLALALIAPWQMATTAWLGAGGSALGLVGLGLAPWLVWNAKQYQHKHLTLGMLKSRFKATAQDYFRLFLQIYLFAAIVVSVVTSVAMDWLGTRALTGLKPIALVSTSAVPSTAMHYLGAVGLALWLLIRPLASARLQNLAWTQTGNSSLRCVSLMRYHSLAWLGLKNGVLLLGTLGLYWPFAAIATARLRIESVRVKTRVDPNILVSRARDTASARPRPLFMGYEWSL